MKNHGGLNEGFGLYFERDGFLSGGVIGHDSYFRKTTLDAKWRVDFRGQK